MQVGLALLLDPLEDGVDEGHGAELPGVPAGRAGCAPGRASGVIGLRDLLLQRVPGLKAARVGTRPTSP